MAFELPKVGDTGPETHALSLGDKDDEGAFSDQFDSQPKLGLGTAPKEGPLEPPPQHPDVLAARPKEGPLQPPPLHPGRAAAKSAVLEKQTSLPQSGSIPKSSPETKLPQGFGKLVSEHLLKNAPAAGKLANKVTAAGAKGVEFGKKGVELVKEHPKFAVGTGVAVTAGVAGIASVASE